MENIKNNCKNLILLDLNNYNFTPLYVGTTKTMVEFENEGIDLSEFIDTISSEILEERGDLYCNLAISKCEDILGSAIVVLKIIKFEKGDTSLT